MTEEKKKLNYAYLQYDALGRAYHLHWQDEGAEGDSIRTFLDEREALKALQEIYDAALIVGLAKAPYFPNGFTWCNGLVRCEGCARRDSLIAELEASATLHARAFERGRLLWQKAHPGENYWPDGGKNVAWLVERIAELEQALDESTSRRLESLSKQIKALESWLHNEMAVK